VKISKGIVTASGVALAALGTTPQVEAEPLEHVHFSDTNIEVIEDYCDLPGFPDLTVLREQYFDGQFLLITKGPDDLAYGAEHLHFTTVRTNLANGKTVTTDGNYITKDQRVIDNGDGTLTIRVNTAGSDHSYNSDGTKVAQIAGQSVFELLIDDGGTPTDPYDDEFLEFLGFTKNFARDTEQGAFCEIIHENLA
jgi:hypothetical protein